MLIKEDIVKSFEPTLRSGLTTVYSVLEGENIINLSHLEKEKFIKIITNKSIHFVDDNDFSLKYYQDKS